MTRQRHENKGLRKVCEHPRRQWSKCEHPWHFNFKPRDPARRCPTSRDGSYRFSLDRHLGRHIDSKSEAEDEAAKIRMSIKAGTFGKPVSNDSMTLQQLTDTYLERYVDIERAARRAAYAGLLNTICRTELPRPTGGSAALGTWRLADIVTDTVLRFREVRRAAGSGLVGTNRHLGMLRAMFNWAIGAGYVDTSPFQRGTKAVVKLAKETSRNRRLDTDEERRLLAQCSPHLRAIVVAAIDTGMRRGEILSLQWKQIEGLRFKDDAVSWLPKAEVVLLAEKTKTRRHRRVPISSRLRAILEMRYLDPAGKPMPGDAFVFGTEIGTRLLGFRRAWHTAVLRAHGHTPTYTKTANLTPGSRAALNAVDLHFHDLRREAGSRWLDGGVPLHTIRDWLGHTNISQTSTYLAGTSATQHDAMARFEAHQAALQRIATEAGTAHHNRASSAAGEEEKLSKNTVSVETAIM